MVYQALVAWLGVSAALNVAKEAGYTTPESGHSQLDTERILFSKRPASEILWGIDGDGIDGGESEDTLYKTALRLHPSLPRRIPGLGLRDTVYMDNALATGKNDTSLLRNMLRWKGVTRLTCTGKRGIEEVWGTDGEQWPLFEGVAAAGDYKVFSPGWFGNRALNLSKSKDDEVHGYAIQRLTPTSLGSQSLNLTECMGGLPYSLMEPPNHASYWDVEPTSGTTLRSSQASELNLKINTEGLTGVGDRSFNVRVAPDFGQMPTIPVAWGAERLYWTGNTSTVLNLLSEVEPLITHEKIMRTAGVVIGCGLIVTAMAFFYVHTGSQESSGGGGRYGGENSDKRGLCGPSPDPYTLVRHIHVSPLCLPDADLRASEDGYASRARSLSLVDVQRSFGHEDDFGAHQIAASAGSAGSYQVAAEWASKKLENVWTPPVKRFFGSFSRLDDGEAGSHPDVENAAAVEEDRASSLDGFTQAHGNVEFGSRLGMLDDRLLACSHGSGSSLISA